MHDLKPSVAIGMILAVLVIGGIALPSSAAMGHEGTPLTKAAPVSPTLPDLDPVSSGNLQAAPDDLAWGERAAVAATMQPTTLGDPTSIEMDDKGYTTWTYNYAGSWCVPYSRLKYPFDLGTQDTTKLSDATLRLTFAEARWAGTVGDPSWSVALNGDPGEWDGGTGFLGDWNIIGSIAGTPTWHSQHIYTTQTIAVPDNEVSDGTNNLWLQQHTFGQCADLPDCATTCVRLSRVQLRAAVKLVVAKVSPPDKTEQVYFDQGANSDIRVTFNTRPNASSVNEKTFVVFTYDEDDNRVYVPGKVKPISQVEYAFTPSEPLLKGVRYVARVYGEEDGTDDWVQDVTGKPMESGRRWVFWTMPDLHVTVKPVQILENVTLIANRPTVVRTFVRWDRQDGVHPHVQAPTVKLDDISLVWVNTNGDLTGGGSSTWRGGASWQPAYAPSSATRKREYRIFTTVKESYSDREKYDALDSVNYYGFVPPEAGQYMLTARVMVKDYQGRARPFYGRNTVLVKAANSISIPMRAVAVGDDYGKAGNVDLSATINNNLRGMRAIYPTAHLVGPSAPSAMAYYSPTTPLSSGTWGTEPGSKALWTYLLQELSALCERTTDCDAMVGFTPADWLVANGLTTYFTWSAPFGALVTNEAGGISSRYLMAHEVGHLRGFEHEDIPGSAGFDVRRRRDMRYSSYRHTGDFMTKDPISSLALEMWINIDRYIALAEWTGVTPWTAARAARSGSDAISSDPLLLVSGEIVTSTGETRLLPWYQMEPGTWQPSEAEGPYNLVFLDGTNQVIDGYTRPFALGSGVRYAARGGVGVAEVAADDPTVFTFVTPYPAGATKAQIRRVADGAVLVEIVAGATLTVSIDDAPAIWTGSQPLTWQAGGSAQYFAVDVSTDGGKSWEAQAINLTGNSTTLQSTALPNTTEAYVRVAATNGFRTATDTAGPFTIDNPPLVGYVDPADGATGVGTHELVYVGFRDAMNGATLAADTFTVSGPSGRVPGTVTYDSETREATFEPATPLSYATTYTARLTTGVKDSTGEALPADLSWTFTTEPDRASPTPVALTPADGEANAPTNTAIAVLWDRALNAATMNAGTFQVTKADGTAVAGTVTYDAAAHIATFTPGSALSPDTFYEVTLKAGVESSAGDATEGDFPWAFTTGTATQRGPALTGSYADYGTDTDGNAHFDQLSIQVGVFITATGSYSLTSTLADTAGAEIDFADTGATLTPGVHFLTLVYDGATIGGRSLDGPYVLRDLLLSLNSDGIPTATDFEREAYRTAAYPASRFEAPLVFTGLPDVVILPGSTRLNAFNVRDYAHHGTLAGGALTYAVELNTQPEIGLTLQDSGQVDLAPDPTWLGSARIAISADDGTHVVQDTFTVLVGWPQSIYLPLTLRTSHGVAASAVRDGWVTLFEDDFEDGLNWRRYSSISTLPYGPGGTYHWAIRDCAAYSGQYSAWPYGGGEDGETLPCGAPYPNTLGSWLYLDTPFDLTYTTKGQVTAKIWTDLAPGAEVCLKVARGSGDSCSGDWGPSGDYYGVCRSGQTQGWQDLTLDLAGVPDLGNMLGTEHMCLAVTFYGGDNGSGTHSAGAYIDDVRMRVCPEGLEDYCRP